MAGHSSTSAAASDKYRSTFASCSHNQRVFGSIVFGSIVFGSVVFGSVA
jgi:hypothetical protein